MRHQLPDGWWLDEGRKGDGTAIFSPYWPHGGSEGDVLYAKASPAAGWQLLVKEASGTRLQGAGLIEVLARLGDALWAEVWDAHKQMEAIATEYVERWSTRQESYRRDRETVVESAFYV